jgi:phage shock protein PspC (stress-responsive transcriptional regulator)
MKFFGWTATLLRIWLILKIIGNMHSTKIMANTGQCVMKQNIFLKSLFESLYLLIYFITEMIVEFATDLSTPIYYSPWFLKQGISLGTLKI